MKLLIVILLALAAAIAISYVAVDDPGYVLITLKPWSIELSFSLFLVLLVALFIAAYLVVRFLVRLWRAPRDIGAWRGRRLRRKAQQYQADGMLGLIEGDWSRAEKKLLNYSSHTSTPILNYVGAAHAAQAQGDLERRDRYLAQAQQSDPRQTISVGLTKAKLQYQSGQLEQALSTLNKLRAHAPKNKKILSLLMQLYQELHNWQALSELAPVARKHGVLPDDKLDQLERLTAHQLLTKSKASDGPLQTVWKSLPRNRKQDPDVIATYVEQLMAAGETQRAEILLRRTIRQQWEPRLVTLYGQLRSPDLNKQLKTAEKWAEVRKNDPELLLTLARLSAANELWGKARSYFEACIAVGGPAEAYQELGQLLEQLKEPESALAYYRQGLERVSASVSPQIALSAAKENDAAIASGATLDSPLESDR